MGWGHACVNVSGMCVCVWGGGGSGCDGCGCMCVREISLLSVTDVLACWLWDSWRRYYHMNYAIESCDHGGDHMTWVILQASDVISQAVASDPDCPYGHFLHFKLAVLMSHEEDGEKFYPLVSCFLLPSALPPPPLLFFLLPHFSYHLFPYPLLIPSQLSRLWE